MLCLDQVGVPRTIAQNLTFPEIVTYLNLDRYKPRSLTDWLWFNQFYIVMKNNFILFLNHWVWDKMVEILQMLYPNVFLKMKVVLFWFKYHRILLPKYQLSIHQHWLDNGFVPYRRQVIIWTNDYLNQWWPTFRAHICITRPRWVNMAL